MLRPMSSLRPLPSPSPRPAWASLVEDANTLLYALVGGDGGWGSRQARCCPWEPRPHRALPANWRPHPRHAKPRPRWRPGAHVGSTSGGSEFHLVPGSPSEHTAAPACVVCSMFLSNIYISIILLKKEKESLGSFPWQARPRLLAGHRGQASGRGGNLSGPGVLCVALLNPMPEGWRPGEGAASVAICHPE